MAKIGCTCHPPKAGCAHFHSGKCRLRHPKKNDLIDLPCVMYYPRSIPDYPSYHYLCCPFLNSEKGKQALAQYETERGIQKSQSKKGDFSYHCRKRCHSCGKMGDHKVTLLDSRRERSHCLVCGFEQDYTGPDTEGAEQRMRDRLARVEALGK